MECTVRKKRSKRPRISKGIALRPSNSNAHAVFSMKITSPKESKKEYKREKRYGRDYIWNEIAGMFTSFGRISVS